MFEDNDYLNSLFNNTYSSTTTETQSETETQNQTMYSPQSDYQRGFERDDYSSSQNFTEQSSYESTSANRFSETTEQKNVSRMKTPLIEKSTPTVNLIKSQAKIRLEARMKIVLSVFSVIVACLMFVSIFNFISANKLQATFSDKQSEINILKQSISDAKNTYKLVNNEDYIKNWAESENYVVKDDSNTIVIQMNEFYEESAVEEVPSNWFNDVCEFFSKLFA